MVLCNGKNIGFVILISCTWGLCDDSSGAHSLAGWELHPWGAVLGAAMFGAVGAALGLSLSPGSANFSASVLPGPWCWKEGEKRIVELAQLNGESLCLSDCSHSARSLPFFLSALASETPANKAGDLQNAQLCMM